VHFKVHEFSPMVFTTGADLLNSDLVPSVLHARDGGFLAEGCTVVPSSVRVRSDSRTPTHQNLALTVLYVPYSLNSGLRS